eukprot:3336209-Pleurochrysis_carterae.AAC.1
MPSARRDLAEPQCARSHAHLRPFSHCSHLLRLRQRVTIIAYRAHFAKDAAFALAAQRCIALVDGAVKRHSPSWPMLDP